MTIRRARRRRRAGRDWETVDEETRRLMAEVFERGGTFLVGLDPFRGDEAAIRESWRQAVAAGWLDTWIAERPGTRPWAWWRFDAPEPRRQVEPGPRWHGPRGEYFGCPRWYSAIPPKGMFESEADYLDRLDLLMDAERRLLAGGAA